jgi:hypothetical protein
MTDQTTALDQADEAILAPAVSDEALEAAASTGNPEMTYFTCRVSSNPC